MGQTGERRPACDSGVYRSAVHIEPDRKLLTAISGGPYGGNGADTMAHRLGSRGRRAVCSVDLRTRIGVVSLLALQAIGRRADGPHRLWWGTDPIEGDCIIFWCVSRSGWSRTWIGTAGERIFDIGPWGILLTVGYSVAFAPVRSMLLRTFFVLSPYRTAQQRAGQAGDRFGWRLCEHDCTEGYRPQLDRTRYQPSGGGGILESTGWRAACLGRPIRSHPVSREVSRCGLQTGTTRTLPCRWSRVWDDAGFTYPAGDSGWKVTGTAVGSTISNASR